MKSLLTPLALAGLLAGLVACGSQESKTQTSVATLPEKEKAFVLDQLVGTWQSDDGKSFERWTKETNQRYHSMAYVLNGPDTLVNEQADIYEEGGHWVFDNLVSGQNHGKRIRFVSSFVRDRAIQFSNPEHDFPNEIHYSLPDPDHVHAFIVGNNEKGGKDTIPFNFTRLK